MRAVFAFIAFFISALMVSQAYNQDSVVDNWPDMTEVRKMLQLRWEPDGKNIKIYVVGYEAAKIDFEDIHLEVENVPSSNQLKKESTYFLMPKPEDSQELKVKVKIKKNPSFEYNLPLD